MHLNEFRRTLIPGNEVSFFNLKKNVNGKVKAVNDTLITIEVDEAGEVKTYHEHPPRTIFGGCFRIFQNGFSEEPKG